MQKSVALLFLAALLVSLTLGFFASPAPHALDFTAPAISGDGRGSMVNFRLQETPGTGRLLVNVESASYQPDVEQALRRSVKAAENYLGVSLASRDFTLEVRAPNVLEEVSGNSAGAVFSAAVIALQSGRGLNPQVAVSATVDEEGNLDAVGGIEEKILAAKEAGSQVFLISDPQELKYSQELSAGIQIKRVKTLGDALPYLLA